jgi:phosphatidylinositol alpha-1,6-mannosyltransferase
MALALRRWTGTPYICFVHGEDVTGATTSRELTWLARRALCGADFVIANSRNTEHILCSEWGLPRERVRLLYPGVDTSYFAPAPRDAAVRRRLGWGERPVILTVGRLQRRKGQDMMIHSLQRVRQAIPDVLYAILGDGEERRRLQALVAQEGLENHVRFLGEANDQLLLDCYRQCDLFVLPNRQVGVDIEGFGMVLLEAQSCGKAVLAGDSGGTAETMRIPQTGRVVCCDLPVPLAEMVIQLLTDPELLLRMGAAGRSWVVDHFDWSAATRRARVLLGLPAQEQRLGRAVEAVCS